jgi:hypothetical protein
MGTGQAMSESNVGPQKGPSSVWKIQAETQYVYRVLDEYHGCVDAIENSTVFATLTHKTDGQQYYVEKPLNEFPDVINQIGCFDCRTIEDASGKKTVVIELNVAMPKHSTTIARGQQ